MKMQSMIFESNGAQKPLRRYAAQIAQTCRGFLPH
jgi:hypothetical protein